MCTFYHNHRQNVTRGGKKHPYHLQSKNTTGCTILGRSVATLLRVQQSRSLPHVVKPPSLKTICPPRCRQVRFRTIFWGKPRALGRSIVWMTTSPISLIGAYKTPYLNLQLRNFSSSELVVCFQLSIDFFF